MKSEIDYYDVILMDIQMPVLNGYEASKAIRALKRSDSRTIPIFALTANAFKQEADEALRSGMNAVITKPLDVSVLLEKLIALEKNESPSKKTESQEEFR